MYSISSRSGQIKHLGGALLGSLVLLGLIFATPPVHANAIQDSLADMISEIGEDGIPRAKKGTVVTQRDRAVSVLLTGRQTHRKGLTLEEIDDLNLSYNITRAPSHGSISGSPPSIVYHPNPGFTGYDSFEYEVDRPEFGGTTAEVNVRVTGSFTAFESGQTRPLALSEDGKRLFALNTPDNRLEIFNVSGNTPTLEHSVQVGMEPVALAIRDNSEVWVVNHLSDSVSIVDISGTPQVVRTLQVGDEPRDIVFAGRNGDRAFVTTARRGQNSPLDPALQTPSLGRANVWVFDANNLGNDLNGSPLNIITLFGDVPRALAASPDGRTVYAAILHSGNKTSLVAPNDDRFSATNTERFKPGPKTDSTGTKAPNSSLIVRQDGKSWWGREKWVDENGKDWSYRIRHSLPDKDVFAIDAMASKPDVKQHWTGVGTTLFNMAVNPVNGEIYVSNTDARNDVRFEGEGERANLPPVTANVAQSRITVLDGSRVKPRHLNTHINYSGHGSEWERQRSLAMPLDMVVSSNGQTLYTAAFGSGKIGVLDTREMSGSGIQRRNDDYISLSDGGPSGLALDESRNRLYVLTRFGNRIITVDLANRQEIASVAMYNPEPEYITEGRRFFYDAEYTSGHGDNSCASCHIFGDTDHLAWDLGNPDGEWFLSPNEYGDSIPVNRIPANRMQHPLKGPMTTQSFRGMSFSGPQHWRGDRPGKVRKNGELLEEASFKEFNPAFPELLGRSEKLTDEEMQAFTDFAMNLSYPPNPIRNLDNSLTPEQQKGQDFFWNTISTGLNGIDLVTCVGCHAENPDFQQFGTDGKQTFEGFQAHQDMKIAHLRNMYTKVGKFGFDGLGTRTDHMGDQIRGFGFRHDGSLDTLNHFLEADVFSVPEEFMTGLVDYMMIFDTGLAPVVGQQITLGPDSSSADHARADLLVERAGVTWPSQRRTPLDPRPECDLVVKGVVDGRETGWFSQDGQQFTSDRGNTVSEPTLRNLASQGNYLTYTCTPPGNGKRIAIDRDDDGTPDGQDQNLDPIRYVSITPENPNAAPIIKEADQGGFVLEDLLRDMGVFPWRPF